MLIRTSIVEKQIGYWAMNNELDVKSSHISSLWKIIEARDCSVAVSRERFSILNYEYQRLLRQQEQFRQQEQEQAQHQQKKLQSLEELLQQQQVQLQDIHLDLEQIQSYAKTLEVQALQLRSQAEQQQSRIEQLKGDKKRLGDRLQKAKLKISNLQQQVEAMQSSKFWKLRTAWVSLKNRLRLNS
ncbi:hypothetical protein O77CONTIG1_00222 [Leptolyngbya sp. O-77]|nr:hypothetical protein O77CONTIG1_00222 [Leptolyngbya sp. O-77]